VGRKKIKIGFSIKISSLLLKVEEFARKRGKDRFVLLVPTSDLAQKYVILKTVSSTLCCDSIWGGIPSSVGAYGVCGATLSHS
jgi:hypothetical protein